MMTKKIKKIVLLQLLFLVCLCATAQVFKLPEDVPTPNASDLGLYGAIPTNNFTGAPNIKIPLYHLKYKDIQVPISLSYHVGAVKLNRHPGWTGLGWTLFAGGAITRKTNVYADEWKYSISTPSRDHGFFSNLHKFNSPRNLGADDINLFAYTTVFSDGPNYEVSADNFYFNFLGYQGSFQLNTNGEWIVKSESDIKVIFDINDNSNYLNKTQLRNGDPSLPVDAPLVLREGVLPNSNFSLVDQNRFIKGFQLITDDGTKYFFGGADATEYTTPYRQQNNNGHHKWPTSWFLTKIQSPSGNEINFNYSNGNAICDLNKSINETIHNIDSSSGCSDSDWECNFLSTQGSASSFSNPKYASGQLLLPVYLESIETTNEKIEFNTSNSVELRYKDKDIASYVGVAYSNGHQILPNGYVDNNPYFKFTYMNHTDEMQWRQLDNIKVISKIGSAEQEIKNFDFTYSNNTQERLKLLSLKERGASHRDQKDHEFIYNTMKMPNYLDYNSDHWGFYNGKPMSFETNMVDFDYTSFLNSKKPDLSGIHYKAETLEKIVYPTKGVTEFIYEPHKYSSVVKKERHSGLKGFNSNQFAGGLRIKTIINKEHLGGDEVSRKDYYYVKGYKGHNTTSGLKSSGILNSESEYSFAVEHQFGVFNSVSTSNAIPGTFNSYGSHVGYSEVVEVTNGNGYSIFKYTNYDQDEHGKEHLDELPISFTSNVNNNPNSSVFTVFSKFGDLSLERGKLTSTTTYNNANKKVQKSIFYYSNIPQSEKKYYEFYHVDTSGLNGDPRFGYCAALQEYYFDYHLIKKTTNHYDHLEQLRMSSTTVFNYNDFKLISQRNVTNSQGEILTTNYKYPFDNSSFDADSFDSGEINIFQEMTNNHILKPAVVVEEKENTTLLAKTITPYKKAGTGYYPKTIKVRKGDTSRYIEQVESIAYYNDGKIKEVKGIGDTYVTYIWGYNHDYLLAKIENASYSNVSSAVNIANIENASNSDDDGSSLNSVNEDLLRTELQALRVSLPKAHVTTYTHNPSIGITSITNANRHTIYYYYDTLNRLKYTKDDKGNIVSVNRYNYKN